VRRLLIAPAVAVAALVAAETAPAAAPRQARVAVPKSGNVTLAQVTLTRTAAAAATPRLRLATTKGLGANVAVLAAKPKPSKGGKRKVTVTIVHRHRTRGRDLGVLAFVARPAPPRFVVLSVPAGYAAKVATAANVVAANPPPPFPCSSAGPVSGLHVGASFRRTSLPRLAGAGCLLALDRPAPAGDVAAIGAEYCAVGIARAGTAEIRLSLQCSFAGIDLIRFDFANDLTVLAQLSFPGGECRSQGGELECAFPGGLRKGVTVQGNVAFDRTPPAGKELVLRVSTNGGRSFLPLAFPGRYPG